MAIVSSETIDVQCIIKSGKSYVLHMGHQHCDFDAENKSYTDHLYTDCGVQSKEDKGITRVVRVASGYDNEVALESASMGAIEIYIADKFDKSDFDRLCPQCFPNGLKEQE